MQDGIFILNKPSGITSQTAVNKVKHILGVKKAGHTGTLDPMATGVLPILFGRGVKCAEYMNESDKHYIATLRLGLETDTEDITGNVLHQSDIIPEKDIVFATIQEFVGKILQVPPMYSALKRNGQKLCDLARRGIEVEREAREITIYSIEVKEINKTDYLLDIRCSKGTYIRTLCTDIGRKLGCYGTMATLCRAEAAGFSLAQAHTFEELENSQDKDRILVSLEEFFKDYPQVILPAFYARLAKNGCEIYLKKIKESLCPGTFVRLYDENLLFFSLGKVETFENGDAIKPQKQW